MKLSFTGSQNGMSTFQKEEFARLLNELNVTEIIHGDCIGSDSQANEIALKEGIKIFHLFPSTLGTKRAGCFKEEFSLIDAYQNGLPIVNSVGDLVVTIERPEKPLDRNKKIVDTSDILIATPKEHTHTLRSGTWTTVRYAWKRKKQVIVIPPIERDDSQEN